MRNKEELKSYKYEEKNVNEDRYLSLSSENFVAKKSDENIDIKKDNKKEKDKNKK